MEQLFGSIFSGSTITVGEFFIIIGVSLLLGIVYSFICSYKSKSSKSFYISTSLIPVAVAMVIMLVNGNIGVGVAVAGAFGLVRFRSAQGSAKEIVEIFIAMASGLALGVGYVAYAVIFTVIAAICLLLFDKFRVFEKKINPLEKVLKITIPEDLDYNEVFNDLFARYTKENELIRVKSTNMGSMFKLTYNIVLNDYKLEKEFVDQLRCRNGNLEILIERCDFQTQDL